MSKLYPECERCKDWSRQGLSNTCPSCDMVELKERKVMHTWEVLENTHCSKVERMAVPNGWLYRVWTFAQFAEEYSTWRSETVFVPARV